VKDCFRNEGFNPHRGLKGRGRRLLGNFKDLGSGEKDGWSYPARNGGGGTAEGGKVLGRLIGGKGGLKQNRRQPKKEKG